MKILSAVTLCVVISACEPLASSEAEKGSRQGATSGEYESCAASADCGRDLQCVAKECRRKNDSFEARYHRRLAERYHEKQQYAKSIDSYRRSIDVYKRVQIEIPPDLWCHFAHTLTKAGKSLGTREHAARLLHRCVKIVPPTSRFAAQAFDDMTTLDSVGFEPALLGEEQIAEKYLVKEPQKPEIAALILKVAGTPGKGTKARRKFIALLASKKLEIGGCFLKYWEGAKATSMLVRLPIRYRYVQGRYEADDRWRLLIDAYKEPNNRALATAYGCVRDLVVSMEGEYLKRKQRKDWRDSISITLRYP